MEETARLNLNKKTAGEAQPEAKEVLDHVTQQIGMVPNLYAFMANAPGLLQTYIHGQELFRKNSGFTPPEQEVVLLSISFENGCEYCMAAHSVIADTQSKVPPQVTDALRNGTEIPDARLRALSEFTRTMVTNRGRPSQDDVATFLRAGYTNEQVLQVILAIGIKTLSNYTNHVCHTPLDAPFASRVWTKPGSPSHAA